MMEEKKPTCTVCKSSGYNIYDNLSDVTFSAQGTWSLYRCLNQKCAVVWLQPTPDYLEIASFYSRYYTQQEQTAAEKSGVRGASDSFVGRAKKTNPRYLFGSNTRFNPDLRYLRGRVPGRVLDIGCGNGKFISEAASAGWQVYGQEFDPMAASIAAKSSGAEVRVGDLLSLSYEKEFFDAVTMSNVLEHLPNPTEVFSEVARILRPGGVLVSISPNPKSYLHQKLGKDWRGLEVPRHLFLFPPQALGKLARSAGFSSFKTFSTLGAFEFMERESIKVKTDHGEPEERARASSQIFKMALKIYNLFLDGDIGEWSVIIAKK